MTRTRRAVVLCSTLIFVFAVGELGFRLHGSFFSIGGTEDPDAFHLYIIGGSTAAGVPYAPLSFGDLVSSMFTDQVGGRPIVLHNLAASGDTVYTQWIRFVRAVRARDREVPGAALIYAGHNDWGGDVGAVEPPFGTRLERGLCRRSAMAREAVFGVRRLLRSSAAAGQDSYGYYLRAVVDTAWAAGLTPVLSTVVGNISDIEPNYDTEDRGGVERALQAVAATVEEGRCDAVEEVLNGALPDGRGREAFAAYRFAHCLRRHERLDAAREAYWRAVELDPRHPFGRATQRHNAVIRRVGAEHGAAVVDAVERFEVASEDGMLGRDLFSDGQHPNLEGHLLLAVGFAEILSEQRDEPVRQRFADAAAVRAAYPRSDPAFPDLHGGLWLLGVSFRHPWPEDRLLGAEARFRAALEIEPQSFTAWMGLGLTLAGRSSDLLQGPEVLDQIDRWGGFTYNGFNVPAGDLEILLRLLRDAGVDPAVVENVEANHPERAEVNP